MDTPTPKIQMLLFRLAVLSNDLNTNLQKLHGHFRQTPDDTIVLNPAVENIVDRKKEKEHRKKEWRVTLKETIDTAIEYDELS